MRVHFLEIAQYSPNYISPFECFIASKGSNLYILFIHRVITFMNSNATVNAYIHMYILVYNYGQKFFTDTNSMSKHH